MTHEKITREVKAKAQKAKDILGHFERLGEAGVKGAMEKYRKGEKVYRKWEKQGKAVIRKLERL